VGLFGLSKKKNAQSLLAKLFQASKEGNVNEVKALIDQGADVNADISHGEYQGRTALRCLQG
jgi:hypothetical protein